MSTTNILDLNNRIDELEKNSGGGGSADSAKRSDIATEFSTETSYTAGNFVYYEGKLYQFNADHSAGAWDPTDVAEANVTDQIVSNASAIAGLTASDVAYDNTDSGLTATNVQGAIDEVLANVTVRDSGITLLSIDTDGVKTFSQLIDQLYSAITANIDDFASLRLVVDTTIFYPSVNYRFFCGLMSAGETYFINRYINVKETESVYGHVSVNASTSAVAGAVTDSSTVPPVGGTLKLIKV